MAEVSAPESPQSRGSPRQNRSHGWLLLVTSWIMRLAGGAVAAIAVQEPFITVTSAKDPRLWAGVIISSVVAVLGLIILGAGLAVGRRARRHLVRVITSVAELTPRSYVLYLRPFRQDLAATGFAPLQDFDMALLRSGRTHEERLARMFRQFGPMVTVGRPGEKLPAGSGAYRFYLPRDDWQDPVRGLIASARVIVLGAAPGSGTIWEYVEVLRRAHHHRLVILVTDPEWYVQFKALTTAKLQAELPELTRRYGDQWHPPALPSLSPRKGSKRGEPFYFRAMIYFGPGWGANLANFDRWTGADSLQPNSYVKQRLKPVLAHLRTAGTIDPALAPQAVARPVPYPPPEPVPPPQQPPNHPPIRLDRRDNPAVGPGPDMVLPTPPADTATFTNMPSRLTLALVRAGWAAAVIGGAAGSVMIGLGSHLNFAGALITLVMYFVLGFFGTAITMASLRRWRTLIFDSRGITVTVASLAVNQHKATEARWEQVVRIRSFGQPGKPRLCAWIRDGYNPSRLIRLCSIGSPDFPIDAILAAIRMYCPTAPIEPPYGQFSGP